MHPLRLALRRLEEGGPLPALLEVVEAGRAAAVDDAAGGPAALLLRALADRSGRDLLVIVADPRTGHDLVGDLETLAAFSPEGSASPGPLFLPALDADPYSGIPAHPDTLRGRVAALGGLLAQRGGIGGRVLVAAARALAVPLPPPAELASWFRTLRRGESYDLGDLRASLTSRGYLREDTVSSRGEYASRGYILDVFPPDVQVPLRLEFFGDSLDSIRPFDPASQRSLAEEIDSLELPPMREYAVGEETARRWAEAAAGGEAVGLASLTDEIEREGGFPGYEMLHWAEPKERRGIDAYLDRPVRVCLEPEACRHRIETLYRELDAAYQGRTEMGLPPPERFLVSEESAKAAVSEAEVHLSPLAPPGEERLRLRLEAVIARRWDGDLARFLDELETFLEREPRGTAGVVLETRGTLDRLVELMGERGLGDRIAWRPGEPDRGPEEVAGSILLGSGRLRRGFRLEPGPLWIAADRDLHAQPAEAPKRRRRTAAEGFLPDLRDMEPGDLVVHADHGIGRYLGVRTLPGPAGDRDFLILEYKGDDKLYQPLERLDVVQKYSGVAGVRPKLDRMGGASWKKVKARIRSSMRDMTKELLELYAKRMTARGHPFGPEQPWEREFADAFPYELTPDQAEAWAEVRADMEEPRPMDRLIVGDVGFGKTEVAMRAAMKAILGGKQVAFLAPTTVLAFQHWRSARSRFADYPVRIDLLSRFRTPAEQKETLAALAEGEVDIVVGTHRLLSRDVVFQDLGLLVVDEEQRFGVRHKERIKKMRGAVDVLTLTATPIPRTLQMALGGLRDMSLIRTPPPGRYAIQTEVVPFRRETIAAAIRRELQREGQVYFVHNRVQSIYSMADMVREASPPETRVLVAHGQMPEKELEETILAFVRGAADILVTTTIIENGVDIPRVNTILVNRADQFGLAQLYQLRGRVGRSDEQAWAWLMVPSIQGISEVARKRLRALKQFSQLGSGFRLAAMDLEIRGAGNLLGPQQSGHIAAVGFEMYAKLLEQTAAEIRGEEVPEEFEARVSLPLDLHLPETYVPDQGERLAVYKRIVSATSPEAVDEVVAEVRDQYGHPPDPLENLALSSKVRLMASRLHVEAVEGSSSKLVLRFPQETKADLEVLVELLHRHEGASLSPQGALEVPLPEGRDPGELALEILAELD